MKRISGKAVTRTPNTLTARKMTHALRRSVFLSSRSKASHINRKTGKDTLDERKHKGQQRHKRRGKTALYIKGQNERKLKDQHNRKKSSSKKQSL